MQEKQEYRIGGEAIMSQTSHRRGYSAEDWEDGKRTSTLWSVKGEGKRDDHGKERYIRMGTSGMEG